MSVLGSESGEDDAAAVGLAVAVGVGHVQQFGAVGDIRPAVARLDSRRNEEAVGEDLRAVGNTVSILILKHQNLVVGNLARLDLRVDFGANDPEPPLRVEVHLDRFGEHGVGGVEIDLEAVGHDERLALNLGIGVGNRERRALGEGGRGEREETEKQESAESECHWATSPSTVNS